MKNTPSLKAWCGALLSLVFGLSAPAASFTNNFDYAQNYVLNGVLGDTNWDGVYLRFGDIPGGNIGGNPAGNTLVANSAITFPGYLSLQSSGGDWAGAGDDGVLFWKHITGDFDVSVQSSPFTLAGGIAFDNGAFQMAGLMARAYNTNNSGSPYPNSAENYVMLLRFQENFGAGGIDEVNEARNGNRVEHTFPDDNATANLQATRYYRIVRSSLTNFTFFWKTNQSDDWAQITNNLPTGGVLVRSDLTGAMQVGIAQSPFSAGTHDAVYTDFQLTAPSLTFPPLPAGAPSALVTTASDIGGSLTFSWTLGNPGDSSLVVVRANGPILGNPLQGVVYPANAALGDPATQFSVGGQYVVYNGTGTSVTVTNLGGLNNLYTVAVFEYTNPAAPVYNTAKPTANTFPGPGIITGVVASIVPTNLPVGGAAVGKLFATFSSGGGGVDESAGATWGSSDPTIAAFLNGSTLSALATGSVTVTGSFQGFTATQVINIHAPAFTDDFSAYHDYVANGLQGSTWDGLFLNFGDVPGANQGPDNTKGATVQFLANTNVLYVESAGSAWYGAGNDGPFIHKIVTGDFQAAVHVGVMSIINNCDGGIMARLFNNSGTASQGGGGGAGGTETHVNWVKIQNGQVAARVTVNSGGTTVLNGLNATDRWLLMQRVNSTNFYLYQGATGTNWTFFTNVVIAGAANNAPMEVGLENELRTAGDGWVPFDTLMIDGPGITPPTNPPPPASDLQATLNNDLSMTFNWVASDGAGHPVRSALIMRPGGPITAFPTLAQAASIGGTGTPVDFGVSGLNVGGGNWMTFVTGNPAASTNVTCAVQNLSPGVMYYAAVITFTGVGANKSINTVLPPSGATTNIQDGTLLGISIPAVPSIPLGGIAKPVVLGHFPGGTLVDISPHVLFVSTNISVIATTNGILTGFGNGTTFLSASYGGFTNVFSATVRPPRFADEFNVNHDYLAAGVAGSGYSGFYNVTGSTNPIPNSEFTGAAVGDGTTVADANITSNGVLTVTQIGQGWENDAVDGFFLFKYVPGDFQMAVHILGYETNAYNQPGLLARAFSAGTNGNAIGSPFVIGPLRTNGANVIINTYGESWISFTRFDEFGIGVYPRLTQDSATQQSFNNNVSDFNWWLLILRTQGTNFNFYMRRAITDPWQNVPLVTTYQVPEFAGQPMQVGIMAGPWTFDGATARTVQFEHFLLDAPTGGLLNIAQSGSNVILSWGPDTSAQLQFTTSLASPNWQPVVGHTPVLGPNGYSVTLPAAPSPMFFRLVN